MRTSSKQSSPRRLVKHGSSSAIPARFDGGNYFLLSPGVVCVEVRCTVLPCAPVAPALVSSLPLSSAFCRCGQPLDPRGHHRAGCATSGVLGRRGYPLESCAARVCREAGARVSTNLRVQDLDLLPGVQVDNRRLEVVADGLPLFHGAQLALDHAGQPSQGRRWSKKAVRHHRRSSPRAKLAAGRNSDTLNSLVGVGVWRLGDVGLRKRKTF